MKIMPSLRDTLFLEAVTIHKVIQLENPDDKELINKIDANLKSYNKDYCPICRVKDSDRSPLRIRKDISDRSKRSYDRCICDSCGFSKIYIL